MTRAHTIAATLFVATFFTIAEARADETSTAIGAETVAVESSGSFFSGLSAKLSALWTALGSNLDSVKTRFAEIVGIDESDEDAEEDSDVSAAQRHLAKGSANAEARQLATQERRDAGHTPRGKANGQNEDSENPGLRRGQAIGRGHEMARGQGHESHDHDATDSGEAADSQPNARGLARSEEARAWAAERRAQAQTRAAERAPEAQAHAAERRARAQAHTAERGVEGRARAAERRQNRRGNGGAEGPQHGLVPVLR